MELDISGSILLGFGLLSSVVSKTGSTEYNLAVYDQLLIASLIITGLSMVGVSLYREYES